MKGWTGQSGQQVAGSATAVLAACGLLAVVGLAGCGPDAAHADTVLTGSAGSTVLAPDGHHLAVHEGLVVPRGGTVVAGPDGATLTTLRRHTYLGGMTEVTVSDGSSETLRRGEVLVDALSAPGLSLDAGAAVTTVRQGTLTRVERGALLRVAQFRGTSTVRASGRQAHTDVDGLFQVQVPFGGLPGATTPLVLTDDQWEQRFARDLVESDLALTALARGLNAGPEGASVSALVPAAFTTQTPVLAGTPRSELALAFAIAAVGHAEGGTAAERYRSVRDLRDSGGSWGVVAALVGARTDNVSGVLDRLLAAPGSAAVLAGGPGQLTPAALARLLGSGSGAGPGPLASSPGSPSRPGTSPSQRPQSAPSPTPAPTAAVADQVAHAVAAVSSAAPTPVPRPTTPAPFPGSVPPVIVPVPGSSSPILQLSVGPLYVSVG